MAFTKWQLLKGSNEREKALNQNFGFPKSVCEILAARGKTDQELTEDYGTKTLEEPFALADMEKAVLRIREAIELEQQICVFGDYDCDGVCAAAILYTYLLSVGANVQVYIPERDNGGYGLNNNAIDKLHKQNTELLITVDNGISALNEADYIASLGIDLIVTDHHLVEEELPKAIAVVNPHREDCPSKFKDLCGAAVAFKLVAALEDGDYDTAFDFAGDLVAIATLGDIMPLVGENRLIMNRGLRLLEFTDNLGLRALIDEAKIKNVQNASNVLFNITPRINAAGRLFQAKKAFELLVSEDDDTARALAKELCDFNSQRRETERIILDEAIEMLEKSPKDSHSRIIIVANEEWSPGVMGIIAAKLTDRFGKPSIVFTIEGDVAVGSSRSLGDFSIFEAIYSCKDLLLQFGGHKLAAGLSIKKELLPEFIKRINEYASSQPPTVRSISIDKVINPAEITLDLIKDLDSLQPFGHGNPQPVFMIQNARLDGIYSLSNGKHLRLNFTTNDISFSAVYFCMEYKRFCYRVGQTLNLVVRIEKNIYQGTEKADIYIIDIRPTTFLQKQTLSASVAFDALMREEILPSKVAAAAYPSRDEFAIVYRFLQKKKFFYGLAEELYLTLIETGINYCKLAVILEALSRSCLININKKNKKISIVERPPKIDLQKTPLLKEIRNQAVKQGETVK